MARARNSKGRFVKGSGRTSVTRARSSGGAIVVRTTSSPARRSSPRRSSGGGASSGTRVRKGAAIGGFILGYAKANYAAQTLDKLPKIKGSAIATLAIGLHFMKPKPGGILDHVATAATAVAAYELGQTGLSGDDAEW